MLRSMLDVWRFTQIDVCESASTVLDGHLFGHAWRNIRDLSGPARAPAPRVYPRPKTVVLLDHGASSSHKKERVLIPRHFVAEFVGLLSPQPLIHPLRFNE